MEEKKSGDGASGGGGGVDRVRHENFCRAVVEDDTALLLKAVEVFRKEAMGRIRKGSEASKTLDQEVSLRLLHLACKHDAVRCARLLIEGGGGLAPAPVDARDQLTRTPLHVAAETHAASCIELLLAKNARADLKVIEGPALLPLEIALKSRRVQAQWSPDKSVEDLLAFLNGRDLKAVKLLAEKTRVVGELAYKYAMEGCVPALAMLLLVVEDKISGPVSVVVDGVRTKKSIYNPIVDEALSMGDAPARDGIERRKALLCEIQLLNQFGSASWREHYDKRTLTPLLRAAKVGDMNVLKMLLTGNVDVNEVDSEGNSALHWCLSSISSTQEPRILWLLLKNGAKVFQGNKLGLTPVHSAAAKGHYKALHSLLLHEPDCVDIPTKTKENPLFFAVKNNSVECVKLLLRFGADPKARNLRKQRPIQLATSQDMRFILSSAKVVQWNHGSPQKHRVISKEISKELVDETFDNYEGDLSLPEEPCKEVKKKSALQRERACSTSTRKCTKYKKRLVKGRSRGVALAWLTFVLALVLTTKSARADDDEATDVVDWCEENYCVYISFDLEKDTYTYMIKTIREVITVDSIYKIDDVKIMVQQTGPRNRPYKFLILELRNHGFKTKLAIRFDNLYLEGFTGAQDKWFRFENVEEHIIPGSETFPRDNDYPNLVGGHARLPEVLGHVTKDKVSDAVNRLATYFRKAEVGLRAEAAAVLIVTFSEAARLKPIQHAIQKTWRNQPDHSIRTLGSREAKLTQDWKHLSCAVILCETRDGEAWTSTEATRLVNRYSIMDRHEALSHLGVIIRPNRCLVEDNIAEMLDMNAPRVKSRKRTMQCEAGSSSGRRQRVGEWSYPT